MAKIPAKPFQVDDSEIINTDYSLVDQQLGGRPKLELNEENIYKLAQYGCSLGEIASILKTSVNHLSNNYGDIIKSAQSNLRKILRKKQIQVALDDNHKDQGRLLIWLGKNLLDQSDKQTVVTETADTIEFELIEPQEE